MLMHAWLWTSNSSFPGASTHPCIQRLLMCAPVNTCRTSRDPVIAVSREWVPALVSMHSTPFDDLLLEQRARMLKEDVDGAIHIMLLDDLRLIGNSQQPVIRVGAPSLLCFTCSSVASTSCFFFRSLHGHRNTSNHHSLLCCSKLSNWHPPLHGHSSLRTHHYTGILLCNISMFTAPVCAPCGPTFSISVLLPRNLSSQLEMKSRKSDLSLLSSVSSSSFGGMRVSVMKALQGQHPS